MVSAAIRWVRSYPAGPIPPHRAYVIDELPRLPIADYDYAPLAQLAELGDDVIVIEWDMAVSREDRDRFTRAAIHAQHEGLPLVAPYRLYAPEPAHYAHRRVSADGRERWIRENEPTCDYFGFGLVYLPGQLVRRFAAEPAPARGRSPFLPDGAPYADTRLTDQTFSVWYRWHCADGGACRSPRVAWDVRPVHLHY